MSIFNPTYTLPQLNKILSKYKKLNYNKFRWWRIYENPNKPLHKRSLLRDKILNGDFDYSHYKYQVELCEHEINYLYDKYYPDLGRFNQESSLLRTRRKRLIDDFEKDESEKLDNLFTELSLNFKVSKDKVIEEAEEFGDSLIEFYYFIEEKYPIKYKSYDKSIS